MCFPTINNAIFFLSIIVVLQIECTEHRSRLVFVQAIWRHGDRAPLHHPYPKDKYTEKFWPRGWSQLTSIGMQQMQQLGSFFKRRYVDTKFIDHVYPVKQVYIRSSDSDRALTSAQAFISGMFPSSNNLQWNQENDWQPFPIHSTSPGSPDLICKPTSIGCDNYKKLTGIDEKHNADYYNYKYSDLFEYLSEPTGIEDCSYYDVNGLYDVSRELVNNMTELQPEWVNKVWPQYGNRSTMELVTEMRTQRMVSLFNSREKAKLTVGTTLSHLVNNALKFRQGQLTQKMFLFSSHDGVLMGLLNALGMEIQHMAPYASTIIMEVYDIQHEYFVEFFYRNDTNRLPMLLNLPDCPHPCSLTNFVQSVDDITIDTLAEFKKECGTPMEKCTAPALLSIPILIAYSLLINFL